MTDYDRDLVETALKTLWDESRYHRLPNETAPRLGARVDSGRGGKDSAVDPASRKSASNPAHAGTHLAVIADVAQAWKWAGLNRDEKAAILGRYGLDMTVRTTGSAFGLRMADVTTLAEDGLGKMIAWLNGEEAVTSDGVV